MGLKITKLSEKSEEEVKDIALPSMEALGFETHCRQSWPLLHPFLKLLETHLEMDFLDHKYNTLDMSIPSGEEARQKWWQKKFRSFVTKELKRRGRPLPTYLPNESTIAEVYPQIANQWMHFKADVIVSQQLGDDCMDTSRRRFNDGLKQKWLTAKKRQFMLQKLGLQSTDVSRQKSFSYYCRCILWCQHIQCWYLRVRYFPINLLVWMAFRLHPIWRPDVLQAISLPDNHLQQQQERQCNH